MNEWTLIIPSGGTGTRMGADRPKQYLEIEQKPIIIHTLLALDVLFHQPRFIVSMETSWMEYLQHHLNLENLAARCTLVQGGIERYHSVKNALPLVATRWVGVHDAVRPFVSAATVLRIKDALAHAEAVIPTVPLRDSLRKLTPNGSAFVPRSAFVAVQTPQCFHTKTLLEAYQKPFDPNITDDASLVESAGIPVQTVLGNDENLKITTPLDFVLAQQLLANR